MGESRLISRSKAHLKSLHNINVTHFFRDRALARVSLRRKRITDIALNQTNQQLKHTQRGKTPLNPPNLIAELNLLKRRQHQVRRARQSRKEGWQCIHPGAPARQRSNRRRRPKSSTTTAAKHPSETTKEQHNHNGKVSAEDDQGAPQPQRPSIRWSKEQQSIRTTEKQGGKASARAIERAAKHPPATKNGGKASAKVVTTPVNHGDEVSRKHK
jgi:hypothetical protein